jgi:glyoxylase-like metal-dependent hydrolase (beta-lactamase superfamily II)
VDTSGKKLTKVWISHAHPDHFLRLDLILDRFPEAEALTTPNVLEDLQADGPWMLKLLKRKLGPEAPERLVEPTSIESNDLRVGSLEVEIVEFGAGEAKHHACLVLGDRRAIVASDLIYNGAHLYLQEHNLDGWLARLDDLEQLAAERGLKTIHPGHGPAGGLSLIQGTREYLHAFASAIETENVQSAREAILSRFPDHHVRQFLDVFSSPPTSPPPSPADRDEGRPHTIGNTLMRAGGSWHALATRRRPVPRVMQRQRVTSDSPCDFEYGDAVAHVGHRVEVLAVGTYCRRADAVETAATDRAVPPGLAHEASRLAGLLHQGTGAHLAVEHV